MRSNRNRVVVLGIFVALATAAVSAVADERSSLRNELGITYAKDGHFEDALRSFSLILAQEPEHAAALNNSANIYFVQGERERARSLYQRAIVSDPKQGGIQLNLGILLHAMGDAQGSAAAVRKGLDLIGDPHEAYWLLGLSQRRPSDNDRAADTRELKSNEIEELLAAAMADIPTAAKKPTSEQKQPATASPTSAPIRSEDAAAPVQTVSTRPGGAKASQAGEGAIVADRLFWMSTTPSP